MLQAQTADFAQYQRNAAAWFDSLAVTTHLSPAELALKAGLTFAAVLACALVIWLLRYLRNALVKRMAKNSVAAPRRPGGATLALLSLAAILTTLWVILRIWGIDPAQFRETAAGALIASFSRAALIITLAIAAIEFFSFALDRLLARFSGRTRNRRRLAQLRTITPLVQGVANTLIGIIAVSMVLAEAGVEIAPLLAGAGVAGIAIGFGAQSLVKDFLTGVFLIVEDIVSRGDVVEINGFSGTVERMTLRTIRLRDFDGTLHVFPYGEAQVIHNRTSIFSYFAFELQISYLSDIDRALEVVAATGAGLKSEEAYAACMLAPVEIVGVDKLSDNGIILKGRIKTEAGEQMRVGREFNKRVKRDLDAAGILIAHRHLPVPPYDTIAERAQP